MIRLNSSPNSAQIKRLKTKSSQIANRYDGAELVPDEIIVRVKGDSSLQGDLAGQYNAELVEKFDLPDSVFKSIGGDMLRLKLPAGSNLFETLAQMSEDERIAYAEPNAVHYLQEQEQVPNDLDSRLWGLHNTGQTGGTPGADVSAHEAWKISTGNGSKDGPLIAVIDTGIDYNHPDLKANMWVNPGEIPGDGIDNDNNGVVDDVHGYYPAANSGNPMDKHSHGTHCAGTIAAVGNNGEGVTGVMQNARLMAVKIFNNAGRTTTADIVKGINYTTRMGADITSNSWGGGARSEAIYEAFKANDAVHIVAAGNSNRDNDERANFPSSYDLDNIVAVAATNHNDERASFSQWGATSVDVAAPGRDIYSTVPRSKGSYGSKSGTSMATPHVTGGAGLILSKYPGASSADVKARLIYGSEKIEALKDISVSDGRVNFANSLEDDKVAPGAPNDFGHSKVTTRGATLSWTSVGDDKWDCGAAQGVELMMSNQPLDTEGAEVATLSLPGASAVGELATFEYEVSPSEQARTVHVGMQSIDNAANRSAMRSTSFTIPAAQVALKDNFEGQGTVFQIGGDFVMTEVEGRGTVFSSATEEATGHSTLTSQLLDLNGKSGTFLKFEAATNLNWRERAIAEVSDDGGESWTMVSKMKRVQDWENVEVDLSQYDGKTIQLRFRAEVREGRKSGGFSLDKVVLLTDN